MTIPNGAAGVDTTQGIFLVSAYGHGDMSPADLVGNDEATVRALYGQKYVTNGTSVFSDPTGPLGQVFSVLGAIPGVGFAFAILGKLIDEIVSVIGSIPIIGGIFTTLASFLGLTHTTANDASEAATVAQGSANTANSAIAELKASIDAGGSGALITDTFDRAQDTSASGLGANWHQVYGTGSGTVGTSGAGTAHGNNVGTNGRTMLARYSATAMTTDLQVARIVLSTAVLNTFVPQKISLCLRMNSAEDSYVEARIDAGVCEIGYVVSGVYTRIGAQVTITSNAGDLWELRAGTAADDYQFLLLQNNVTVCDRTDAGHASQKGASYRYPGVIEIAGVRVVFGSSTQRWPPDMQVFTATDYTP